jgi:cytochrome c-type biogenesis protein CcmH/NrfG
VEALKKATEAEPDNVTPWTRLGYIYYHQKDFPAAVVAFSRAVECPDPTPELYIGLAKTQEMLDLTSEAVASYEKAVALQPDNLELLGDFCLALTHADRLQEAEKIIQRIEALREEAA